MPTPTKKASNVISALKARSNFGQVLQRVQKEQQSLVIVKRGTPRAVLLSLKDYVRLAAPEPDVLRIIGEESVSEGTDSFSSQQIDKIIRETRAKRSKRK